LSDDYADVLPEEMEEALGNILDGMSPAESFNFTKALQQIGSGVSSALSDPQVAAIVKSAAPVVGAAAGTAIGGPIGTAIGGALGNAAAQALPSPRVPTTSSMPPPPSAIPPAPLTPATSVGTLAPSSLVPPTGGSVAAAKGLVLSQQPDVLKSLLALALGSHGQSAVNGIPVGSVMSMLSSLFGQAAEDADALLEERGWSDEESSPYLNSGVWAAADRADALYAHLMETDETRIAEAIGWDTP
jgi:hypothetical protein